MLVGTTIPLQLCHGGSNNSATTVVLYLVHPSFLEGQSGGLSLTSCHRQHSPPKKSSCLLGQPPHDPI